MSIYADTNYRIELSPDKDVIIFKWEDAHRNMSYEDFQEACCNFIGFAFEYQTKRICIDVRNFQLSLPEDFKVWQENIHYPRYYKLGIQKVAYVMPEAAMEYAKEIPPREGKFTLKNFANEQKAFDWLA